MNSSAFGSRGISAPISADGHPLFRRHRGVFKATAPNPLFRSLSFVKSDRPQARCGLSPSQARGRSILISPSERIYSRPCRPPIVACG